MKPSENRYEIAAIISQRLMDDIQGQIVKPSVNEKIMALYFILNSEDDFIDVNLDKYEEYINILNEE